MFSKDHGTVSQLLKFDVHEFLIENSHEVYALSGSV